MDSQKHGALLMIYIGVDPGLSGAAVVLNERTDTVLVKAWSTTQEAHEFLRWTVKNGMILHQDKAVTVVEKVTRPTKLTRNAGEWVGLLTALGIPFKEITPQKWQKHFGKFAKERTRRKNQLKQIAQQLCPEIKWTHKTADAYLLAVYAKEVAWT